MIEKLNYTSDYTFSERIFNPLELAKTETIMCLGNGYLGLRSSAEELYALQSRGLFIAGIFNKIDKNEVSELPNCADFIGTDILLDGQPFDMLRGSILEYEKELNMKDGRLTRKIKWELNGKEYFFDFERFVSNADLHIVGQKIKISVDKDVSINLTTGINGRVTNSGAQHFNDGEKRFVDKKYLQVVSQTTQSKIAVCCSMGLQIYIDGKKREVPLKIGMDRRRIMVSMNFDLKAGQCLEIEKIVDIRTNRDLDSENVDLEIMKNKSLDNMKKVLNEGYLTAFNENARALDAKLWSKAPIKIHSSNFFDQLANNFAKYHLHIMTPAHDSRMNIGAKGLSGEGYKGHTFWDTEIFALPQFIYSNPQIAKSLVKYRYLSLVGARKKAKENGYKGAQFPWESAWIDDGEVTPAWSAADIVTGIPLRIESGFIEQHITSDVAFGIWQYYVATDDEEFMKECGYEVIFETAKFWTSRLEFCEEDSLFHINDVIGPDEYKEHINDNAFTNYMAWWNIRCAISYYERLKEDNNFQELLRELELEEAYKDFISVVDKIYLPAPNCDNVIAQDSTYLSLKEIDLEKYKNQSQSGGIYEDYNAEQISKIQVTKQADVLLLLLLFENLFSDDVKQACWNFYEPRTLHDSSLSLSTHTILACDLKDVELAYKFFERASRIDLGENMHSCNDGVHAAALAGIWQSTILGFGGVRMLKGELRIKPKLPKQWSRLEFVLYWKGQRLEVDIFENKISIVNCSNEVAMKIQVFDETIYFDGSGKVATAVCIEE